MYYAGEEDAMKQGDIVWGYTTVPEIASPYMPPVKLELLDSFQWGDKTLWNCRELDGKLPSCWIWDQAHLAPEPVRPITPVVE